MDERTSSIGDGSRRSRLSGIAPPPRGVLARRAALALALFAGLYLLGAAVCAALLWVPYAELHYEGRLGFAGIACAVAALWTAWALLPPLPRRRDESPIEPLDPSAHPRLFALIEDVARAAGEPMPDEVLLLPDANAFAARRGGRLGVGGRRVIGIGLPLLGVLDEGGLRAVLAHELGHHRAGDLRLGPIVHRTRAAVALALARLSDSSFWLHLPFALYARAFLRLTLAISREQELAADRFAAKLAGRAAVGRSLLASEHLAPRWGAYFHGEYVGLLAHGARPPLLEGFERFLAQPDKREDVERAIARAEARASSDEDTHPSLEERLDALSLDASELGQGTLGARERGRALGLLADPSAAEGAAIELLMRPGHPPLREVAWDDVGESVWIEAWRKDLAPLQAALARMTPRKMAEVFEDPERLGGGLLRGISIVSPEARRRQLVGTLGLWLVLWLHDRGCAIEVPPGADAIARRGERAVRPERMVRELARGELDPDELVAALDALLAPSPEPAADPAPPA